MLFGNPPGLMATTKFAPAPSINAVAVQHMAREDRTEAMLEENFAVGK